MPTVASIAVVECRRAARIRASGAARMGVLAAVLLVAALGAGCRAIRPIDSFLESAPAHVAPGGVTAVLAVDGGIATAACPRDLHTDAFVEASAHCSVTRIVARGAVAAQMKQAYASHQKKAGEPLSDFEDATIDDLLNLLDSPELVSAKFGHTLDGDVLQVGSRAFPLLDEALGIAAPAPLAAAEAEPRMKDARDDDVLVSAPLPAIRAVLQTPRLALRGGGEAAAKLLADVEGCRGEVVGLAGGGPDGAAYFVREADGEWRSSIGAARVETVRAQVNLTGGDADCRLVVRRVKGGASLVGPRPAGGATERLIGTLVFSGGAQTLSLALTPKAFVRKLRLAGIGRCPGVRVTSLALEAAGAARRTRIVDSAASVHLVNAGVGSFLSSIVMGLDGPEGDCAIQIFIEG
jgi:hypothetical protein